MARGFKTMYIKIGFDLKNDLALARAIKEEVGDDIALRVDANEAWTAFEAIDAVQRFEDVGVEFLEQPIDMHDIAGMADLRTKSRTRIGANQSVWQPWQVPEVLARRAGDVIVTDQHQLGGLVPFRDAAAMCEVANVPVIKHAFGDLAITTIAATHVLGTLASPQLGHQQYLTILEHDLLTHPGRVRGRSHSGAHRPRSRHRTRPGRRAVLRGPEVHLQPVARAGRDGAPGERFTVDTQDCFTGLYRDPANFSPETAAWVEENLNCVTGPISVAGAKPGDAIEIHIESVAVTSPGSLVVSRCQALSPADWWHEEYRGVSLPVADGRIRLRDDWTVPVRPLIGCLATAPGREAILSRREGSYGGNMDCNEITSGATVVLPVETPGAFLYFGDCKAAMGNGEITAAPEVATRIVASATPVPRPSR